MNVLSSFSDGIEGGELSISVLTAGDHAEVWPRASMARTLKYMFGPSGSPPKAHSLMGTHPLLPLGDENPGVLSHST